MRWSPAILAETRKSLIERGLPPAKVDSRLNAMQAAFPDATVNGFESIVPSLQLPDENDRHVLAAAIAGNADQIVTSNVRDFPRAVLDPFGIEPITPDDFLMNVFDLYPEYAIETTRQRAERLTKPHIGVTGILASLRKSGAPNYADAVAARLIPDAPLVFWEGQLLD